MRETQRVLLAVALFLLLSWQHALGQFRQQPGTDLQAERASSAEANAATGGVDTADLPPLGVYVRRSIPEKTTPIPYTYVREADVLWSKIIWRTIDLRQKINLPLYYPTVTMKDRKSLSQALLEAVMNREVSAYEPEKSLTSPGDEYYTRLTPAEALQRMGAYVKQTTQQSMTTGRDTVIVEKQDPQWAEVRELLVKEEWFFDSKHSRMQVRIMGICPVRVTPDEVTGKMVRRLTFWVYYPECRNVLARTMIYNPLNDAQTTSYDDLFFKRRFDSFIIRESNEYNNRSVSDYKVGGVPQLKESDKIKNNLFIQEHDLWEY